MLHSNYLRVSAIWEAFGKNPLKTKFDIVGGGGVVKFD